MHVDRLDSMYCLQPNGDNESIKSILCVCMYIHQASPHPFLKDFNYSELALKTLHFCEVMKMVRNLLVCDRRASTDDVVYL